MSQKPLIRLVLYPLKTRLNFIHVHRLVQVKFIQLGNLDVHSLGMLGPAIQVILFWDYIVITYMETLFAGGDVQPLFLLVNGNKIIGLGFFYRANKIMY